jgi:hypothetical protein
MNILRNNNAMSTFERINHPILIEAGRRQTENGMEMTVMIGTDVENLK